LERELEQLFREHYHMLYRTAYSLLENKADAEDVPQSLFLRLLRNGMTPDLQKNAKGYLYRAAVNLSLNMIRERKRQPITGDSHCLEDQAERSDSDAAEEIHRRLAEAIAELEPEAAQTLVLRYVHNYSDSEIAKLMGTSRGTIAMRLFRYRARLKKLMGGSLGGLE
jgi:RNA polymerase sigma-70 factor (ECF subfamily)